MLKLIVGIIIGYFEKVVIIKSNIMKTKIIVLSFVTLLFVNTIHSQTKTTVNASNSEISDNLDLKAVASIFGDSENLEDFEKSFLHLIHLYIFYINNSNLDNIYHKNLTFFCEKYFTIIKLL